MESPQPFYLSSKDFLLLEPKSVSKRDDILALNAKTGSVVRSRTIGEGISGSPAVAASES